MGEGRLSGGSRCIPSGQECSAETFGQRHLNGEIWNLLCPFSITRESLI